jgi:hypothetical protein
MKFRPLSSDLCPPLQSETRPAAQDALVFGLLTRNEAPIRSVYEIDFGAPRARAIFIRPREEPRPALAGSSEPHAQCFPP